MPTITTVGAVVKPTPRGPSQLEGIVKATWEEGTATPTDEHAAAYASQSSQ